MDSLNDMKAWADQPRRWRDHAEADNVGDP
jgi:hypothetical protein